MYFDELVLGMTVETAPAANEKEKMLAGKSTRIEWLKPVFADNVLNGKAVITNLVKRNEKNGFAEVTIHVFNQNGSRVLTDVTEAIVKCRTRLL